jgi:hypothetical protein
MKLEKTANGHKIRMSQKEWTDYGRKAGWIKESSNAEEVNQMFSQSIQRSIDALNYVQDRISKGVLQKQETDWLYELGKQVSDINRKSIDLETSLSG